MKLSICVVTMNRAKQLSEALQSCLACELPSKTEFVIIDNASTDNTDQVVKDVLDNSEYSYYYEKMAENLGCGGGRNYAYNHSKGEFVYVLDDDAVIDVETSSNFFIKAIKIFEDYPDAVSLTSQIYDTAWNKNRVETCGPAIAEGLYHKFMFCGGSHFLRKEFFPNSPYLSNQYGNEEMPPSLMATDKGKLNIYCPSLLVIHKPAVDKWNWGNNNKIQNIPTLINGIAFSYAIKSMMYPMLARPLIWAVYTLKKRKYLKSKEDRHKVDLAVKEIRKSYKIGYKIRFKTFCSLVMKFGKTAL